MAKIAIPRTTAERRKRRHLRVRKAVSGTQERPRLVVFRSLKHIYAQIVDDVAQRTLMTVGSEGMAAAIEAALDAVANDLPSPADAVNV